MIPAAPAQPRLRVAQRLEQEIEALIQTQGLKPGDRLPSERALAVTLAASRASLREAIGLLVHRKIVEVRKAGIIVAQPLPQAWAEEAIGTPLTMLVAEQIGYGHDVMEVRSALEGTSAYYAALRADEPARRRIRERLEAMEATYGHGDPRDQARLDAAFHLAIAEASNNAILRHVMSSLFGLLQNSISQSLEKLYLMPRTAEGLAQQHRALYEAIVAGDAEGARGVSDAHLKFVETSIRQIDDDLARKVRARAAHITSQT
ncbi:MAG TPA: FCD domain-containing protein [Paenirhodobacter sp.]